MVVDTLMLYQVVNIWVGFSARIAKCCVDGDRIEKRTKRIIENGELPLSHFLTDHGRKTGTDGKDRFVVINLTFPLRDIKRSSPKHGLKLEIKPTNP